MARPISLPRNLGTVFSRGRSAVIHGIVLRHLLRAPEPYVQKNVGWQVAAMMGPQQFTRFWNTPCSRIMNSTLQGYKVTLLSCFELHLQRAMDRGCPLIGHFPVLAISGDCHKRRARRRSTLLVFFATPGLTIKSNTQRRRRRLSGVPISSPSRGFTAPL